MLLGVGNQQRYEQRIALQFNLNRKIGEMDTDKRMSFGMKCRHDLLRRVWILL
jgi:hypothetical protein